MFAVANKFTFAFDEVLTGYRINFFPFIYQGCKDMIMSTLMGTSNGKLRVRVFSFRADFESNQKSTHLWLSVEELARLLNKNYDAVRIAIKRGKYKVIKSVKSVGHDGKRYLIHKENF